MIPVTRLNHAVLYVRDAEASAAFYRAAFDFEVVAQMGSKAVFLRSLHADNHHDLGLFTVGPDAAALEARRVGLYHLAWEVPTIEDLAEARTHLLAMDVLVGENDHGVSKSLYARDPDGNEFEVLWTVPREAWGDYEHDAVVQPLDLEAELARFGSGTAR